MAGRKKVKKNTKLLSFGEEAGDDEAEAESAKKNMVRPDLAPSTEPDLLTSFDSIPVPPSSSRPAPTPAASSSKESSSKPSKSSKGQEEDDLSSIRKKAIEDEDAPATQRRLEIAALESSLRASKSKRARSPSDSPPPTKSKTSHLQDTLASYSRGRGGSGGASKGKGKAKEEDDILAMLGSFRKKMQSAPKGNAAGERGEGEEKGSDEEEGEGEGREVDNDEGWMGHRLIEERDEKAAEQTRRAETDYEVIDTRGKAQQALTDKRRDRPPPKKDARSSAQWAGRRG
ncbi:hypothetical protein BDY24DRAFT_35005 [Mrakia frigida]|uniref:uncharacterized protein n=1 Tax=Mrakia frigida TaxID=29902 RepID=UPI003FCC1AE9